MALTTIRSTIANNDAAQNQARIPHWLVNIWQQEIQENIWKFNQVNGVDVPVSECPVYVQSQRDTVARGLISAFRKFADTLGYPILPMWFVEDIPLGGGNPYQWQQLQTRYGYISAGGQRATELIEAGATITYSESNAALGVNDTATITVTTTYSADEIEVYFTATDSGDSAASQTYRINPVTITKSGNTATITGHRALFVKPAMWKFPYVAPNYTDINEADTSDAGDFVTTVDVYRVYNDDTTQVQLLSDPVFTKTTALDVSVTDTAALRVLDARLGIVQVRRESGTTISNNFYPQIARVYYRAGYPLSGGEIDNELAWALVRYANTIMMECPNDLCDRAYYAFFGDRKEGKPSAHVVTNPFGVLHGQIESWRVVSDRALGRGGKLSRGIVQSGIS